VSIVRTGVDYDTMIEALLIAFKQWARIDHDDDDGSLGLTLMRGLDLLERQWGVVLNVSTWRWVPREANGMGLAEQDDNRLACMCRHVPPRASWKQVPVPIVGIAGFRVDRDGTDVSADFSLTGDTFYPDFGQAYLSSADGVQPGDVVMLSAGPLVSGTTPNVNLYPPAVVDVLFRYCLFLWENREAATDKQMADVPDWVNRAWALFWQPRV